MGLVLAAAAAVGMMLIRGLVVALADAVVVMALPMNGCLADNN